jgi:hypothetical protein
MVFFISEGARVPSTPHKYAPATYMSTSVHLYILYNTNFGMRVLVVYEQHINHQPTRYFITRTYIFHLI